MTDQATDQRAGGKSSKRASKHYHHGKTPAAWAGSMIAMVGFVVGGIGMVLGPNWVLFWIGAALLVIACIVGLTLQKLGYGAN